MVRGKVQKLLDSLPTTKTPSKFNPEGTMVPEGTLTILLRPGVFLVPDELLRQRVRLGEAQVLVRWKQVRGEDTNKVETSDCDAGKHYFKWMKRDEVVACCPHLLRQEKVEEVEKQTERAESESNVDIVDEEELRDMQHDVSELVKRARRQMRKGSPAASLLANTIHVLSAYARSGTLASAFRESGALDLLLDLVWSKVANVRQSAGHMLKALASHDSGSRAYVLLSLTRTENDSPADAENRTTLMELFAETASKEEHGFSFDNISLPQVSGRVLFSLMKKYLRVTSLLDELDQIVSSSCDIESNQTTMLQFELACATSQLIMDLSEAMGWNKSLVSDDESLVANKQPALSGSIFAPSAVPDFDIKVPSKKYKKRSDFPTREAYGEYVKTTLDVGIRVVMLEDYESVSAGDIGEFKRSNDGTPPAQFRWEDYGSTYWVHWEMVEILDPGNEESSHEMQESQAIALKSSRLPYGFMASKVSLSHSSRQCVSQAQWWEVLAALKQLPHTDQDRICERIEQLTGLESCHKLDDLVSHGISLNHAQTVLQEVRNLPSGHLLPSQFQLEQKQRSKVAQYKKAETETEEPVALLDEKAEVKEQEDLSPGDGDNEIVEKLSSIKDETKAKELREALDFYANRPFVLCKALDGLYSWVNSNSKSQVGASEGDSVLESVVGIMANLKNMRQVCEAACQVLKAFCNKGDEVRINVATNGAIKAVLLAMHSQDQSLKMQVAGLEALKDLLGASTRPDADYKSSESSSLLREVVATIATPVGSYGGLPTLASALRFVVLNSPGEKKNQPVKNAIDWGLACLHILVSPSSSEPSCLISHIVACGTVDVVMACLHKDKENMNVQQLGLQVLFHLSMAPVDGHPSADKEPFTSPLKQKLQLAVLSTVLSVLSSFADKSEAVLSVCTILVELVAKDSDPQGYIRKLLVEKGLLKTLILALDKHKGMEDVAKKGLQIFESLSESCEEQVCDVAADGAISWVLAAMQSHTSDLTIVKIGCRLLELMTRDLDNAIVMAANSAKAILTTAIDKHSVKELQDVARQLLSRMEGLDERVALHERILQSVLGGTIQLCLSRIDEARSSQTPLNMLHVEQLIRQLCIDSDLVTPSDGQCWEKIEVSSNNYRKNRLTDGDKHSYWESSGSSGSHWARLHMLKGIVIRKLTMLVNPSDSSYMPQRVVVYGGSSSDSLTELKEHNISSSVHSVTLLENMKKHYPIIQIKVKRCQQGGIDTRIRGIQCEGPRASYWPLFSDAFTARTLLYHHIQTRTWASLEIGALDLFDRFSNAVWHEQEFADQFLPTQESRVALGNACRAALVTPLLTAVTATDQSNPGSIAHLITQYVSHVADQRSLHAGPEEENDVPSMESPQLMELSRTRRMCRLLVDCDHGPANESNYSQPQSGAGLHLMSECWRSLVRQRAENFLSDHSSHRLNPLDFTHLLCDLYQQLTQTMNELFGGHSRFAVALNEGLAGAFKSLNEVSGVEVCETVALAIDALLDKAGKDSSHFQHLGEGERERQLRELAQPLHCLRDLDLAHVFEHFYRRHLSRRLLRGRSVSIDLEKKAAQEYDACFRLKWPKKMLEDMTESDKLMNWFVDHQMELLDVALTQSTFSQLEIQELFKKLSVYRRHHLVVHTLTPCHWPLKSRLLTQQSALPATLSQFCEDYELFFVRQSCSSLRHYERVRKLKWTLYGWAVIGFSGLQLVTGTPHMILLNVFNSHKRVTFSKLKELTRLNDDEVRSSLVALTANRQKVLLQHRNEPVGSGTDSEAEETAYLDCDSFSVNEDYLNSVKTGVTTIRIHTVHLVGACGEDSVGRRNLAHVFERRKAIIDTAIVRLLKKAKFMAIDAIAMQVMKGCQEGQFEGHKPFGSFECHYQDICLAIGRLTSNGYLKRDEENSNVLHYVPDSSLSETPADDATGSEEPVTTDNLNEAVVVAVSQSETIGDDKKKKTCGKRLTKQKSSMDGKPSPASPGVSRGRASKKSPAFIRMYSCDVYAHDPSPVSLPHTSATLCSDEVKDELLSMCNRVAQVLKLNLLTAQHLLCHCKWNEDAAIHRFLSEGNAFLIEAGLEVNNPLVMTLPSSCPVCDGEMVDGESLALACNHAICKTCWKHHLSYQIQLSQSLSCTCPVPQCTTRPNPAFIQETLGEGSEELEKFQQAVLRSYVEGSGKLTWCRNPQGCDQILLHGGVADVGTCSKCGWTSCFSCTFTEAHYPASCQQISQWVDEGGFYEGMNEEAKSKQLAKIISKKCPRCSAPIEKNEGCLHMTCKCGHDFCWRCLKPWRPTHSDYYHCSAKVSKGAKSGKRFVDINQQCAGHHAARLFAERLSLRVGSITESVPVQFVTFVVDACRLLQRARKVTVSKVKCIIYACHEAIGGLLHVLQHDLISENLERQQQVLSYSCVYLYYAKDSGRADYLGFIAEALEGDTNALQAMLENTVLRVPDIGHAVRTIQEQQIASGEQLMARLQVIIDKVLLGSRQHYHLGENLKEVSNSLTTESHEEEEDSASTLFGHLGDVVESSDTSGSGSESDSESSHNSSTSFSDSDNGQQNQNEDEEDIFDEDEEEGATDVYSDENDYDDSDYDLDF